MTDLESVLAEIRDNTGISVSYTVMNEFNRINEDIVEKNNKTSFKFVFKNDEYLGEIASCGEESRNYAYILSKMLSSYTVKNVHRSKNESLLRILFGDADNAEIFKFTNKYSVPDLPCFALYFSVHKNIADVEDLLVQATNSCDMTVHVAENACVLIKFEEDEAEYQSAADYANFLAQSIFEEAGVRPIVGVGGTGYKFCDINSSFEQAETAVRMCKTFNSKGEVHTYKEYLFVKMMEEIPELKKKEYLNELMTEEAKELLSDEDMLNTAEEFLLNSLNVSETSRNLYMHRNTLMYRLDKIEKATGMNIKKFSDAISFRVLTVLYKLLNK